MKKRCWLLALICLLLAGCGKMKEADSAQEENVPAGELPAGELPAGEQPAGELQEGPGYYVEKVDSLRFQEAEEEMEARGSVYRMLGDEVWLLRVEQTIEADEYGVFVQSYGIESGKTRKYRITPQIPGKEGSAIYSADLTTDRKLSLKMKEEGKENAFFLVQMSLEGEILRTEERFPESGYPWNQEVWSDMGVFGLADGRTVVSRYDSERNISRLTWYQEDGKEKPLGDLEDVAVLSMTVDGDGILYYLGNDDTLVRWDVEQNTREILFRLHENGIEWDVNGCGISVNDEGMPRICSFGRGTGIVYRMTDREIPGEDKIRLCSLEGEAGIYYFQKIAAGFRQNGGSVRIALELEKKSEYQEDYRNRILAEMTVGKGPDILYLSREDMILLQEKGLLLDLTDMISEEVREQLIPGALELGSVDGELVGLVPEVNFSTVGVSRSLWDQDGWTVEEFMDQVEEKGDWQYLFDFSGSSAGGRYFFNIIIPAQLESLSLLDLEAGTCDFKNEKFIRILEFCKKFSSLEYREGEVRWDRDESARKLREGESAADIRHLYGGLTEFTDIMERYGDDCRIVGFPTGLGSGNYVDSYSYGYLVVNAETKQKEEIRKFFDLLLSIDNQMDTSGCSVRMDVLSSYLVSSFMGQNSVVHYNPSDPEDQRSYMIAVKPDGTSYVEEFLEFVKSCTPEPYCPPEISRILREEGTAYFENGRSAEETADTIQRRVWLYLEENK